MSSLEYPQPYPPDLRCNYSIRVERGYVIHLKFLEPFEIDDHQQVHCPYDQLQVQPSHSQRDPSLSFPSPRDSSQPYSLLDPLANRGENDRLTSHMGWASSHRPAIGSWGSLFPSS